MSECPFCGKKCDSIELSMGEWGKAPMFGCDCMGNQIGMIGLNGKRYVTMEGMKAIVDNDPMPFNERIRRMRGSLLMDEKRETEFAFIFGQLMGFLSNDDIKAYLKERGVPEIEYEAVLGLMKNIAKKAFYNYE